MIILCVQLDDLLAEGVLQTRAFLSDTQRVLPSRRPSPARRLANPQSKLVNVVDNAKLMDTE